MTGLVLTGDPDHVTTPLAATITSLANNGSGAIRAATGSPHFFATADRVIVDTTVVAGTFAIVVIDSTHFDLVGSTFTATGTGSATDVSLTPQIQVPVDGMTGSLQLSGMLSTFQAIVDRTQYLQEEIDGLAFGFLSDDLGAVNALASTWSAPVLADSVNTPDQGLANAHAEWDPVNLQWLIGANGVSQGNILLSFDGLDETWAPLISGGFGPYPTSTPISVGKDPNDATTYYAGVAVASQVLVSKLVPPGTTSTAYSDVAAGYTDVQLASFNGYEIIATANSASNAKNNLIASNDKFSTTHVTNVGAATGKPSEWILRSGGGIFIAMPRLGNGGFALPYLWTSTDGHTFTQRTLGFLLGTDILAGLDYGQDAVGACWILSVQHIAGGTGGLYRSSDGLNWTPVASTAPNTLANVISIAAMGRIWVAVLAASPGPHTMIWSGDTITWYQMSAKLVGASGEARIRSNGFQMAATNASGARFSFVEGPAAGPLT